MGYSNATLLSFVNSQFFARDTNQTGFFGNSTGDLLYSSFKQVEPSQLLQPRQRLDDLVWRAGEWKAQTSGNRRLDEVLPAVKNESQMQFSWYGDRESGRRATSWRSWCPTTMALWWSATW